jgi:hypothetical protein
VRASAAVEWVTVRDYALQFKCVSFWNILSRIFNYFQQRIDKSALGEMLLYAFFERPRPFPDMQYIQTVPADRSLGIPWPTSRHVSCLSEWQTESRSEQAHTYLIGLHVIKALIQTKIAKSKHEEGVGPIILTSSRRNCMSSHPWR